MAISLKHNKASTLPDGTDASLVQPSDWNAEHTLTLATSRLLGRTSAGTGAAEEISVGSGLSFASGSLSLALTSALVTTALGYTPPQPTGTGASGTWGISITGNAATVTSITSSQVTTALGYTPPQTGNLGNLDFNTAYTSGFYRFEIPSANGPGYSYGQLIVSRGSDTVAQLVVDYGSGAMKVRAGNAPPIGSGSWSAWRLLLNDANYSSYALPLSGGTMTGSITSTTNSHVIGAAGGTTRGYLYSDTSFGLLNAGGNWQIRIDPSNFTELYNITYSNDIRSAIVYDRNDTGYYADFNNLSVFNVLQANGRIYTGYDSGVAGSVSCSNWFRSSGASGWYNASYGGGITMEDGTWVRVYGGKQFYAANYIQSDSSVRAPIFYDTNDTGWYCDPNSRSRFVAIDHATGNWLNSHDGHNRILFDWVGSTHIRGIWGDAWWLRFGWQNNDTGVIFEGSGNIYAQGNVTAYWSDRRLKTNIRKISNWREIMDGLNGYFYEWNEKGQRVFSVLSDEEKQTRVGLIAQEVKAVLPQAATIQELQFKNGKHEARDDIADIVDLDDPFLTVREEKLIPVLVEAIKGLMAEVDELKAKMELH